MKILLSFVFSFISMALFAQYVMDPNAQQRPLSGSFSGIKVSGGIDLYLNQSGTEAIAVSAAEAKYADEIKTVIENNMLRIYIDNSKWSVRNKKLKAYVSFKQLETLEASGACDVKVSGEIKVTSLKMDLSGASDFTGAVNLQNLKLDLSGASDVKISGEAGTVTIENSGASDVKGRGLVTDICHATAFGASDIEITVNKEINARASGASKIYYSGTAALGKVQTSGAGLVEKKG